MSSAKQPVGDGAAAATVERPEWHHLWFTLQARPWSALAIVDTTSGSDGERVARMLAEVARRDAGTAVEVISAQGAGFQDLPGLLADVAESSPRDLRLVACDTPATNPAMIPILQAVTGAVVVVRLGDATTAVLDSTIAVIGREKIIASVSIG